MQDLSIANVCAKLKFYKQIEQEKRLYPWDNAAFLIKNDCNNSEVTQNMVYVKTFKKLQKIQRKFRKYAETRKCSIVDMKPHLFCFWMYRLKYRIRPGTDLSFLYSVSDVLGSTVLQPKQVSLLWRIKLKAFVQGVYMQKYLSRDFLCVWCSSVVDSVDHRFFSCAVLEPFWNTFKNVTGTAQLPKSRICKVGSWRKIDFSARNFNCKVVFEQIVLCNFLWVLYRRSVLAFTQNKRGEVVEEETEALHVALHDCRRILDSVKNSESCAQKKFNSCAFQHYLVHKIGLFRVHNVAAAISLQRLVETE